MGYIVNKFEQVWGGVPMQVRKVGVGAQDREYPQVNKFEYVTVEGGGWGHMLPVIDQ